MQTAPAKTLRLGALTGAAYCVGTLLIATSILDFVGTVWPLTLTDVNWRYGAVGLLSGFTLTPLLGGLILALTASLAGHRNALLVIGVLHLAAALVLVLLIGGFTLDTLQVRRAASEQVRSVAEIGAIKAAIKLVFTVVALLWIGVAGLRRPTGRPAASTATSGASQLLVSQG